MKLNEYLASSGLTLAEFAQKIGVFGPQTVWRYTKGGRIPKPEIIARIAAATNGAVTANDFHG